MIQYLHEKERLYIHTIKVAKNHGIDISMQRSRPVSKNDSDYFDYIVALDSKNKADLEAFGFQNVYKLGDFGGFEGADVPDPYFFSGFEGFEKVYKMIEQCVYDL